MTRILPGVLAVLGLAAVLFAVADVRGTAFDGVRTLVTAVFLLLGPGWALAGFLAARSLAERFVVAAGTGVAVGILVGQAMVVSGAWHPVGMLYVVAVLSVPALAWHAGGRSAREGATSERAGA